MEIPPRQTAEMEAKFDDTEVIPDNVEQPTTESNASLGKSMATLEAPSARPSNTSQEGLQATPANSNACFDFKQPTDDIPTDSILKPASCGAPPINDPEGTPLDPGTDTGWAWVVLAGAFAVYAAALGSATSLSVYLNVWMDYFGANAATVGFVMSTHSLMRGIFSKL